MAPKKPNAAPKHPAPVAAEAKLNGEINEMRQFCQQTALVQLAYFALRTAWHVGVPAYLGARQFVPLVLEVAAAELLVFLLFWVAGSFGPAAQERSWLFNIYNLLALIVLAKCATDSYIYSFAPHMWQHYSPKLPWGVPTLIAASLPESLVLLGMQPSSLMSGLQTLERWADILAILACFRGVRTGKALMKARRVQRRELQKKKDE
ncbi:expressed protein [Chlorella variabilis]|uniref:Expressed protein n=1 Tax=Chlorella variabilis TaxID=554065 RepID=E1ZTD4_CHLVA|nr:expressed protein [Chlorella variabilis]EFN50911.1 expressed protein [Chlorella variabilis]|eukprot:XP_005843013.1 expressed protein [Chlorella variabilis]